MVAATGPVMRHDGTLDWRSVTTLRNLIRTAAAAGEVALILPDGTTVNVAINLFEDDLSSAAGSAANDYGLPIVCVQTNLMA